MHVYSWAKIYMLSATVTGQLDGHEVCIVEKFIDSEIIWTLYSFRVSFLF